MTNWYKWLDENAVRRERRWYNGIEYIFATLEDGYVAIFEVTYSHKVEPLIQASDMAHAVEYCVFRGKLTVPFKVI